MEGGNLQLAADSIDVELYPFAVAGTRAGSSVITVDLDRSRTPFDAPITLRFEK